MAKLGINTGSNADDGTGDSLRVGAGKINSNFNEVYSLLTGAGNNGSTLLSGIVTSITAGTNISLTGGPTGAIQIASSAVAGSGKFVTNSTGIHTLGSVGIGTTTAENNGLSVLGNVKVGKGVTTLNLNVSGVSTFSGGDINISGDNYTLMWDASVDTLEFGDNAKIAFGAGSDLTLYHDGSNSYVKDQAAGNLYLDSNGTAVVISKAGAAESMADFQTDGPVRLFYNNARKFETISTGATVVGDLHISNGVNIAGVVTANKFLGDGSGLSNLPGINTSGTSNFTNLRVSGVSTFAGDASVGVSTLFVDVSRGQIGLGTDVLTGSHLLDVDGSAVFAGVVTATTFSGALTGNVTGNASGSSGSCSGNAATATILATARDIGGVSFNGSASINLPGVNQAGNQNTTGTAAGITEADTAVSSTSATTVLSFAHASYRGAFVSLSITQGSNYQIGKFSIIHDGTTVTVSEEFSVATGSMLG